MVWCINHRKPSPHGRRFLYDIYLHIFVILSKRGSENVDFLLNFPKDGAMWGEV